MTSLPGPHGCGDLGPAADAFIDRLAEAGQTWWQMLPINPPSPPPGNSPYSSGSIAAGSPWMVSLELLRDEGWLTKQDFKSSPQFPKGRIDFAKMREFRSKMLRQAYANFSSAPVGRRAEFDRYVKKHSGWLDDETLYAAVKRKFNDDPWYQWPKPLRDREPDALAAERESLADEINFEAFVQYQFARQWKRLRERARSRKIWLVGDMPIFVSHDSVPVWCRPDLWLLDKRQMPSVVSGTPPDAFAAEGQKWGHPLYDWSAHEAEKFEWWVTRFRLLFEKFDAVRIDHFLGLARLWAVPAKARNALKGNWLATPGDALLAAVGRKCGRLPLIAEDLGVMTKQAAALRDKFGLPGMRILQFGFGSPTDGPYHRPHDYPPNSVAYTGTHDNDTLMGFISSLPPQMQSRFIGYARAHPKRPLYDVLATIFQSSANTVIIPMQDVIGLGSEARMNRPGQANNNWGWRMHEKAFYPSIARILRRMTEQYDRIITTQS